MSRNLYWRIPHRRSHRIESDKLMRLLDFCLELFNFNSGIPIYDREILSCIKNTIQAYGQSNKENKADIENISEMIEAIEKHGEIELFYEY